MKQIFFMPYGVMGPYNILCGDTDHDSLNELIFSTYSGRSLWEIWEQSPFNFNHYNFVFADTGPTYPYPPGIHTGNFSTQDIGDIDRDGLTDLVGSNIEQPLNPDTFYNVVTTQESPNYSSYPDLLTWSYRLTNNAAISNPFYFPPDLDNDGRNEIMLVTYPPLGVVIFENIANNQNEVAWNTTQGLTAWAFAFGDFDTDGIKEFVTADGDSRGRVFVYKNTGPDQYQQVYVDTVHIPNGSDVFSGNDVDSNGHPEFFVCFARLISGTWNFYLYMWDATGNNTYQRTLIDQISGGDWFEKRSKCGDVDGDGIDEIVWSIGSKVMVYKAIGNNQFQRVWEWYNNFGYDLPSSVVNVHDMNKNGYNEIIISGYAGNQTAKTAIFEIEAVRVLSPNGGEVIHADSSELIRWHTFHPPRCDSMSLFYSIDNGRNYTMITHGVSENDTSYLWTVPDANSDSCKIKIIAYGPGWQYDESDGVFSITSTGITEIATLPLAMTISLKAFPSPTKLLSIIRYSLPSKSNVSLQLFDISGRLVKTLINQEKNIGNYSLIWNGTDENDRKIGEGVYFCILKTNGKTLKQKILMVK